MIRYLILFLLVIAGAQAKTQVYAGEVASGATLMLDNRTFTILISAQGDAVVFQDGDNLQTVEEGKCRRIGYRELCFNESEEDEDGDFSALITMYNLKPEIEIDREIDKENVDVGETAIIQVTLTNTGDIAASDVQYLDDLPDSLVIDSAEGCFVQGSNIFWKGDLSLGDEKQCEYTVHAKEELDTTLIATATYFNGFEETYSYSDSIRFYTNEILTVTKSLEDSKINPNEITEFWVNLTNNAQEKLDNIKAVVYIPSNLQVVESGLTLVGNAYVWEGELEVNKTKKLYFLLKGKNIGIATISMDLDYYHLGQPLKKANIKQNIEVVQEGISLSSLLTDNYNVDSNQDFKFTLSVKNLNKGSSIKDIHARITGDISHFEEMKYDSLEPNGSKKIYDQVIRAPNVEAKKTYPITVNVSYSSEFGERYSATLTRNIIVHPITGVEVSKTASVNPVTENSDTLITVYVRNLLNQRMEDAFVFETLPKGVTVTGQTSAYVDIPAGQKIAAYSYSIRVPDQLPGDVEYLLNSTLAYKVQEKDYMVEDSYKLTARPKGIDLRVRRSVSDTSIYMGEIIEIVNIFENWETTSINDITLHYAIDTDFDTVNSRSKYIGKIDPGEKITLTEEKVRPKSAGTYYLEGAYITYYDRLGRNYTKTLPSLTLKVLSTYLDAPVLFVDKSATAHRLGATNITISNLIRNTGTQKTAVTLTDDGRTWESQLEAGDNMTFTYIKEFGSFGKFSLSPALIVFEHMGNTFSSRSNVIDVEIKEEGVVISETEDGSGLASQSNTTVTTAISNIYKKSLLKSIIDWIKGLFGVG